MPHWMKASHRWMKCTYNTFPPHLTKYSPTLEQMCTRIYLQVFALLLSPILWKPPVVDIGGFDGGLLDGWGWWLMAASLPGWGLARRLYSYVLWWESSLCKTPHFQWIYGKLNQIYEKLRSDQMDPKSALGGPKPISRTGGSLIKNWSYTSNQCIYFSILLYWRPHLAKTLFILHKYIKCALL